MFNIGDKMQNELHSCFTVGSPMYAAHFSMEGALSYVSLFWRHPPSKEDCITMYQKVQPATRAYFQLLRRALAYGLGFFGPLGKKRYFMLFSLILGHFWCSVVTSVTLSCNLIIFEKNPKKSKKKIHKNLKNQNK